MIHLDEVESKILRMCRMNRAANIPPASPLLRSATGPSYTAHFLRPYVQIVHGSDTSESRIRPGGKSRAGLGASLEMCNERELFSLAAGSLRLACQCQWIMSLASSRVMTRSLAVRVTCTRDYAGYRGPCPDPAARGPTGGPARPGVHRDGTHSAVSCSLSPGGHRASHHGLGACPALYVQVVT